MNELRDKSSKSGIRVTFSFNSVNVIFLHPVLEGTVNCKSGDLFFSPGVTGKSFHVSELGFLV